MEESVNILSNDLFVKKIKYLTLPEKKGYLWKRPENKKEKKCSKDWRVL
jgi:hypothetical protein